MQNIYSKETTLCSIAGCDGRVKSRGWCGKHYQRHYKHGSAEHVRVPKTLGFLLETIASPSDECVTWPFSRKANGYGAITINKKKMIASRAACLLAHGDPPTPTHEAAHSCGNGHLGCVNPRHIRWATKEENEADKIAHGVNLLGERNPQAKITEDDVREIRRRFSEGISLSLIANAFEISKSNVWLIATRKTWRHIR